MKPTRSRTSSSGERPTDRRTSTEFDPDPLDQPCASRLHRLTRTAILLDVHRRSKSFARMGRILLQEKRVTAPEKRLTNRRQTADRRAASRPQAVDQSGSAGQPPGSLAGAICPKCGSARTSPTAQVQVEDESHQLNLFRCETCHSRFVRATES
jgi:hypothetical protein